MKVQCVCAYDVCVCACPSPFWRERHSCSRRSRSSPPRGEHETSDAQSQLGRGGSHSLSVVPRRRPCHAHSMGQLMRWAARAATACRRRPQPLPTRRPAPCGSRSDARVESATRSPRGRRGAAFARRSLARIAASPTASRSLHASPTPSSPAPPWAAIDGVVELIGGCCREVNQQIGLSCRAISLFGFSRTFVGSALLVWRNVVGGCRHSARGAFAPICVYAKPMLSGEWPKKLAHGLAPFFLSPFSRQLGHLVRCHRCEWRGVHGIC